MKLTQEIIDQIQEAMLHTKKDGTVNWKDTDEIVVSWQGHLLLTGLLLLRIEQKTQCICCTSS